MRNPSLSVLVLDLSGSRKKDGPLVSYLAERGFPARRMRDPKRAEEHLRRGNTQLMFIILGRRRVAALSSTLRRFHEVDQDVPTIVISPRPSLDEAIEVMRGRAFDYLAAPGKAEIDESVESAIDLKGYFLSGEDRLHQTLGTRLREARAERRLTLRQLAGRSGLSAALISQVERARTSPSVGSLLRLSTALKMKLSELFSGF